MVKNKYKGKEKMSFEVDIKKHTDLWDNLPKYQNPTITPGEKQILEHFPEKDEIWTNMTVSRCCW